MAVDETPNRSNPPAVPYRALRVAERLLLTGHSYQAWPDVALQGQIEASREAAEEIDEKWRRACERSGAALLLVACYAANVVPLSLPAEGPTGAFVVVGGGDGPLQLGDGNAFRRLPTGSTLRARPRSVA
jgi:hypothetical protein